MKTVLLNTEKAIIGSLEVLDNFSKIIAQKEYSITTAAHQKYLVATGGVGPCLFIAVYHPKTKTAMGIHYDDNTQKEALMGAVEVFLATTGGQINELEVAILGGYRSWPSSKENADATVKFFKGLGITPDISGLFIDGKPDFLTESGESYACTAYINAKTGEVGHFVYQKLIEGAEEDARIKTCEQLDSKFTQVNHLPFSGTPLLPRDVFAANDPLDQKAFANAKLLCDAAKDNQYTELERLLKTGISPNIGIPPTGMTPLHYACLSNNAKTAGLIIQYGGDNTIVDNAKRWPLDLLKDAAQRKKLVELFISEKKSRMERRLSKTVQNTVAAASATATTGATAAASANASAEAALSAAGVPLAAAASANAEVKTKLEKNFLETSPAPSSSAAASKDLMTPTAASNATPTNLMVFSATANAVKSAEPITPLVATPTAAAALPAAASTATQPKPKKKKKKKKANNAAV